MTRGRTAGTSRRKRRRVLLVDENPRVLKSLTHYLRESGYEVYPASASAEAWRIAAKARPDVAVLDIAMRGMGKFDVAIQMNVSLATYRILYLFLAARSPKAGVKHSREASSVAFLKKPFTKGSLLKVVSRLLPRKAELPSRRSR